MELLFIFFVLYMIFSAVAKGLRAAAAQKNPPLSSQEEIERDLPSPGLEEDSRSLNEPAVMSTWQKHLYPNEPLLQQEVAVEKPYVSEKPPKREKQPRKDDLPLGARSQQREVSRVGARQTSGSKPGLKQLLRAKNLPLAIIAAEVLSAPRSKKPFSQRNR